MTNYHAELQARLMAIQHEFDDGEITEKGYHNRRARVISQYNSLPPPPPPQQPPQQPPPQQQQQQQQQQPPPHPHPHPRPRPQPQLGLQIHSVETSSHPANVGYRESAMAAMADASAPRPSSAAYSFRNSDDSGYPSQSWAPTPDHNPSLLRPGVPMPESVLARLSSRNSLFLESDGTMAHSRTDTMLSADFAFKPDNFDSFPPTSSSPPHNGTHSMLDSNGFFFDFAGQQLHDQPQKFDYAHKVEYGSPQNRYVSAEPFSPIVTVPPPMLTANDLPPPEALEYQLPLEPREVPFEIMDPHDPDVSMSTFDNLAAVLRYRGRTIAKTPAFWVLDSKGKETASITWDKFASKAEKVAQVIREKSSLYRGDRVALVYRDSDVIDFAIALMGCFIAGVVAVPINDLQDYQRLNYILISTQAHLALTTDNNLKAFQRDITAQKLTWPRGVEWWKTNEFGSHHTKRKEVPGLNVPDLAYIEFSRAPTGDMRGVVLSHRTIMHQMVTLSAVMANIPGNTPRDTFNTSPRDKNGRTIGGRSHHSESILSYLDPRHGIGMILGILLTVYNGHTTIWFDNKAVDVPGLYAHLITKYRATIMVADYPGLKRAAYNYQQDPLTTRNYKKGMEPNFQTVKLCLIDTLTVDSEFHEVLADRWLRPLRNPRARDVVSPMLCLPEHGGMVISLRDWLGGEQSMGVPLTAAKETDQDKAQESDDASDQSEAKPAVSNGFGSLLGGGTTTTKEQQDSQTEINEVLLDREALKTNEVVVVAYGAEARKKGSHDPSMVRVGAFGYPIPDATLAVVDPETGLLASPHSVGEIWVDSPSLSGGFWAQPKNTEAIFHARPYKFEAGAPTPTVIDPEFLRTGLLGTVIEGKIFILGLYEDRIRQRVEWVEHGTELAEYRYFFVQHMVVSIVKNCPKTYDCSAFDVFVNDEHLPVVVLETAAASTAPLTSGGPPRQPDMALLDSLAERCMEVLMQEHHLRLYCVMITAPNSLPRVIKSGRREIGNMLCRREFDLGNLPCVHIKFGVEHAVLNLPIGIDPIGGIWSQMSSAYRESVLMTPEKQYSGIDRREVVIDDRTSTPLNNFSCITDLIQWRVARQPEELAYCTIDGRGREGKGITWRKFDCRVAAVAMYLKNKVKVRPGDHLILMHTHSEDFILAVHACISLGAIIIPMAPLDQNRLNEDVPAFLHIVADYKVKAVLVNNDVDHLIKLKAVSSHIKQSAHILKIMTPNHYNTSKPHKQNSGLRDLGLTIDPAWIRPGHPVIIWTYWTADQRRIAVQLGHDTIMGMCKVQKETCQMTSNRPVLGCVRSTTGLGFLHSCLMGIYIGTPTYLLSPLEFAQNPMSLFAILARYKIKDTYATSQMLDHAMAMMQAKGFALHELKNMMISTDSRPRVDIFQKVRINFAQAGLDRTAINTVYSHVLNPMIASRSYMCIEPIELYLDTKALRRGLILPADAQSNPKALLVQDSGMVPVSTQIAIVNPESRIHCLDGEYGEIWVDSEACVKAFYGSKDMFDAERFDGRTVDGDPSVRYVRTGDLGFLHNVSRPIGPNGAQVDMQVLFVLGGIGETFEINGLSHFPMDIESSVERCHRNVVASGCAVFQAGGYIVALVEVSRKAYLASIVPVIVNAILSDHQIMVDVVAFVYKGDFPRSRLGEKQRGKILAGWVTRKLKTVAQFAIRDDDAIAMGDGAPVADEVRRTSMGSVRSSAMLAVGASSLRNVEIAPQISEEEEYAARYMTMPQPQSQLQPQPQPQQVIMTPPPPPSIIIHGGSGVMQGGQMAAPPSDHSPRGPNDGTYGDGYGYENRNLHHDESRPTKFISELDATPPTHTKSGMGSGPQPQIRLPGVDGRENLEAYKEEKEEDAAWTAEALMQMNLAGTMDEPRSSR